MNTHDKWLNFCAAVILFGGFGIGTFLYFWALGGAL
jgi:hypothetical protein